MRKELKGERMKYKAEEILEEFASSYSEVDIERLANSLEEIRKETAKEIYDWIKGYMEWDEEGVCRAFADAYEIEV